MSTRLPVNMYSDIVHRWNHRTRKERAEVARLCQREGHIWREAPMSTEADPVKMCTRCCTYLAAAPKRKG